MSKTNLLGITPGAVNTMPAGVVQQRPERTRLPSHINRCRGDNGANPGARCRDCARREQLQYDAEALWFPAMLVLPRADGSCSYWIREACE